MSASPPAGEAIAEFYDVVERFAELDTHPVAEVLATGEFRQLQQLPPRNVEDRIRGYSWYYHAHPPDPRRDWPEHGHFHLYGYSELVPPDIVPLALPREIDEEKGGLLHLFALCISPAGVPDRIFALNRWASDEWLYPAATVAEVAQGFCIEHDSTCAMTSRWLGAMTRLLRPQLSELLEARDRAIRTAGMGDYRAGAENTDVEVAATMTFDLGTILAQRT